LHTGVDFDLALQEPAKIILGFEAPPIATDFDEIFGRVIAADPMLDDDEDFLLGAPRATIARDLDDDFVTGSTSISGMVIAADLPRDVLKLTFRDMNIKWRILI